MSFKYTDLQGNIWHPLLNYGVWVALLKDSGKDYLVQASMLSDGSIDMEGDLPNESQVEECGCDFLKEVNELFDTVFVLININPETGIGNPS